MIEERKEDSLPVANASYGSEAGVWGALARFASAGVARTSVVIRLRPRRLLLLAGIALAASFVVAGASFELSGSRLQAWYLSRLARRLTFGLDTGASKAMPRSPYGPYDERMGYARLPDFLERLQAEGYLIEAQARSDDLLVRLTHRGLFPVYREKTQGGLEILADDGNALFRARYPERVYADFETIPARVVDTLLFIENRELLDADHPQRNPAVEWDRLALALFEKTAQAVSSDRDAPGGSTLATQLEKFRHSAEGRTPSMGEKLRQMASASVRAYLGGPETLETRRELVLDYVNSIPLAALPGYGEVNGLGDGLWAWFGADFTAVNRLLERREGADPVQAAKAYRQVLSLFLAHRRPSFYLLSGRGALAELTDRYLRLLWSEGVITAALRDDALRVRLIFNERAPALPPAPFVERKSAHAVRARLLPLLGLERVYDLDRLDLTVATTLDERAQNQVSQDLRELRNPKVAAAAGLIGERLLDRGDPSRVVYSFTLYERAEGANLLRVQTDNYEQPLNINEGVKLELGSTAKLRTLATYLEIVTGLHELYGNMASRELRSIEVAPTDQLTRWSLEYLQAASDRSLAAMLQAAMDRRYSASPFEAFYTGGGRHTFENFDPEDDTKVITVREAFRDSVNLVFIRLMRDIVNYYMFRVPGSSARILEDTEHPLRKAYLERYAEREGREFLSRFYRQYRGLDRDDALEALLEDISLTPKHLAVIFRSVRPNSSVEEFAYFLKSRLPQSALGERVVGDLYDSYSPDRLSLVDRGYTARVHPLELWVVAHLADHPEATREEIIEASAQERREVYRWLFNTRRKGAQDVRIRSLLEVEAFLEIHRSWKRHGYPFSSLVPSYATSIGSSADRPAALAELVGTILNGGVRQPTVRLLGLHFAAGTPFETVVRRAPTEGERVLAPEIAAVVREELIGVVVDGTARRVQGAFRLPGDVALEVGGKTGTGDNRFYVFGPSGRMVESRVVNRTATFVFLIGDRFFGTVTAYVPGPEAGKYGFTSSLPVQILKYLAPSLMPLIEDAGTPVPAAAIAAR